MQRACVINCSIFVEKIFPAEPLLCSFGTRTAFLPIVTNYNKLYLTEVRILETVSEFSCKIVGTRVARATICVGCSGAGAGQEPVVVIPYGVAVPGGRVS